MRFPRYLLSHFLEGDGWGVPMARVGPLVCVMICLGAMLSAPRCGVWCIIGTYPDVFARLCLSAAAFALQIGEGWTPR